MSGNLLPWSRCWRGPRCVRLVTTRNDLVLPEDATRVWVDAMETEEAILVLCRGLSNESHDPPFQLIWESLVTRLSCWPLLLTLAHGMLVTLVNYGHVRMCTERIQSGSGTGEPSEHRTTSRI